MRFLLTCSIEVPENSTIDPQQIAAEGLHNFLEATEATLQFHTSKGSSLIRTDYAEAQAILRNDGAFRGPPDRVIPGMVFDAEQLLYHMCKHCDHFVDEMGHMDNGEQEYDHAPESLPEGHTLPAWQQLRPDLFMKHADDAIGPNSEYHPQQGKMNGTTGLPN